MSQFSQKCKKKKKNRLLGIAVTGAEPSIWLFWENRHPNLNFSLTSSFLSSYFFGGLDTGSVCTVLKNCVDRGKTAVGIQVLLGSVVFFFVSPCTIEPVSRSENRHPNLNLSRANCFLSTHFKFWGCVVPGPSCTVLKNCVYRGKAAVGIQVLMGSVFLCHPVLHYTILMQANRWT